MASGFDAYKGLPKTVKIGPFSIKIKIMPESWREKNDAYGICDSDNSIIYLCRQQGTPEFATDTLIHELMHAVYRTFHLATGDDEERICGAMATGFSGLLQENPKLLQWIASHIHPPRARYEKTASQEEPPQELPH